MVIAAALAFGWIDPNPDVITEYIQEVTCILRNLVHISSDKSLPEAAKAKII